MLSFSACRLPFHSASHVQWEWTSSLRTLEHFSGVFIKCRASQRVACRRSPSKPRSLRTHALYESAHSAHSCSTEHDTCSLIQSLTRGLRLVGHPQSVKLEVGDNKSRLLYAFRDGPRASAGCFLLQLSGRHSCPPR